MRLIQTFAGVFPRAPILVVTDSWFGNNGLLKPLRRALGSRAHLLSRLRVNAVLHDLPVAVPGRAGRPRKYGERLGSVKAMQTALRATARTYSLNLYGRVRDVVAAEQVAMLKSLRCQVRVVWVYRRTQWIALVTTDLTLTVAQIIEIYGARWKIEAGFREIKQEIGSAQTQTRNPDAVTNHLHFCMVATTITWLYAASLEQAPARRYAAAGRTEYAFADVRRALAHDLADVGFGVDCDDPRPRHPKSPHRWSHAAGRLRKTKNFRRLKIEVTSVVPQPEHFKPYGRRPGAAISRGWAGCLRWHGGVPDQRADRSGDSGDTEPRRDSVPSTCENDVVIGYPGSRA